MQFIPPLKKATLIKRYKRFLADVILEDGRQTTLHVANTGAMTGCATPGDNIWFSTSNNPKRKYPYSWEFTQTQQNNIICVNTIRANQLVEEAIKTKVITELSDYKKVSREVKYGSENSKIDFLLTDSPTPDAYVEVKSVTLLGSEAEPLQGYFPDAVTTRGQKHIRELIDVAKHGNRAILLFAVLHSGIDSVKIAKHIDPKYNSLIIKAKAAGVEIFAYKAEINVSSHCADIQILTPIEVII